MQVAGEIKKNKKRPKKRVFKKKKKSFKLDFQTVFYHWQNQYETGDEIEKLL